MFQVVLVIEDDLVPVELNETVAPLVWLLALTGVALIFVLPALTSLEALIEVEEPQRWEVCLLKELLV